MFATGAAVLGGVGFAGVQWCYGWWSLLQGSPKLMDPAAATGGMLAGLFSRQAPRAWEPYDMPPLAFAIGASVLLAVLVAAVLVVVWLRVDRWRGRSHVGEASWHPGRKVRPRAFAKPRDLLHLQPRQGCRSGVIRRSSNKLLRVALWERRAPATAGGDSWPLGRVRGAELRSGPEHNLIGVAPTGAGKTLRLAIPAIRQHDGPGIFMSNKLDVIRETIAVRAQRGPVWIYAPLTDLDAVGLKGTSWTPLDGCRSWSWSLRMAGYLLDADPRASSAQSDGGRFYNREAVEAVLPGLLHAAALSNASMVDVLGWLRGGVDAIDVPLDVLLDHRAGEAANALQGIYRMDDKTRSLLKISGAQILGAYRLPEVRAYDHTGFNARDLLDRNGTLYLLAPESEQEELAPLFGGVLGEVLRTCEQDAQAVRDPRELPLLKIVADEAAHLAPLRRLPTYLAVSRAWNVRWGLIYQSVAQLRHRYGVEADAILANALSKVFLGPLHDRATCDELMGVLGEETVTRSSHTTQAWGSGRSSTEHEEQRAKLTRDKLARLSAGQGVLIHGSDLPAEVQLPFWWQAEGARTSQEAHANEHERQRRAREDQAR